MVITVTNNYLKTYHARNGYNKVFGNDVDFRSRMDESQSIERFENVWESTLKFAIENADMCEPKDARRKLKSNQQAYLNEDQEHREFWLHGGLFIAQLNQIDENTKDLTQLWFISSSNVDPRTLFITFETCELRDDFRKVAAKFDYKDEDLGKKLLMDFMDTVLNSTKSE